MTDEMWCVNFWISAQTLLHVLKDLIWSCCIVAVAMPVQDIC